MKAPRMTPTLLLGLALCLVIAFFSPQQLPVIGYKLALVALAGVVGYAVDRTAFPYARPHKYDLDYPICGPGDESGLPLSSWMPFVAAQLRRALIIAAAMLAVGLGL